MIRNDYRRCGFCDSDGFRSGGRRLSIMSTMIVKFGRRWHLKRLFTISLCLVSLFSPAYIIAGPRVARNIKLPRKKSGSYNRGNAGMSYIPGATFMMGTEPTDIPRLLRLFGVGRAELFEAESPRHPVTLSPYYIDHYEVTNIRFKKFVDRNAEWGLSHTPLKYHNGEYLKHWVGGTYPVGLSDHPVVNVSWYAAVAFCRWEGKRLPTEAEREYAARGGLEGKQFPWGDEMPDRSRANFRGSGLGTTVSVGSYAPNGFGLYDMAGNVWEFVADAWGPYAPAAQTNPLACREQLEGEAYLQVTGRRVIRGGSWGGAPVNLRVAYRDSHPAEGAKDFVGFRCARSVSEGRR